MFRLGPYPCQCASMSFFVAILKRISDPLATTTTFHVASMPASKVKTLSKATINSARFIPSNLQICNPQLWMLDVGMSQCLASTSDPAHFACSGTDASHQRWSCTYWPVENFEEISPQAQWPDLFECNYKILEHLRTMFFHVAKW